MNTQELHNTYNLLFEKYNCKTKIVPRPNIPFEIYEQVIDVFGKARKFKINIGNADLLFIPDIPYPPLNIPIIKEEELALREGGKEVARSYCKQLQIPFEDDVNKFIIAGGSIVWKIDRNDSFLLRFIQARKLAKYLQEYMFYLIAYTTSSSKDIEEFIHNRIQVVDNFDDNIFIPHCFTLDSPLVKNRNTLIVPSETVKYKLVYTLKLLIIRKGYDKLVEEYKLLTYIPGYFSNIDDFRKKEGMKILTSTDNFEKWCDQQHEIQHLDDNDVYDYIPNFILELDTDDRMKFYFIFDNKIYISIPSLDLNTALKYCTLWDKTRSLLQVSTNEEEVENITSYFVLDYVSSININMYKVGEEARGTILRLLPVEDGEIRYFALLAI